MTEITARAIACAATGVAGFAFGYVYGTAREFNRWRRLTRDKDNAALLTQQLRNEAERLRPKPKLVIDTPSVDIAAVIRDPDAQ